MEGSKKPQDLEALLAEEAYLHTLASTLLEGEADDLVQQTYLRAMQDRETRVKSPRSWLSRILRNLAINTRRGRDRNRAREARAAVRNLVPSSTELMEWEEQRLSLVRAVDGLDEIHRTVILLRYFEGFPPRAIATRLDLPVATVWNRLRRGLELLRQRLDAEHDGDRRAWALPLISLATHSLAIPGVIIMGVKLKMAAAVAVFVTVAGGVVWGLEGTEESEATNQPVVFEPIALAESAAVEDTSSTAAIEPDRSPLLAEELAATTGSLNLTVIYGDDKSPAAEVGFELRSRSSNDPLEPRVRIRTDGAGQAMVEGLEAGRYFLFPDLKTLHSGIEILAGEETECLVELAAGINIAGIVVDADDHPVSAAEISLSQFAMVGDVSQVITTSGADGRFKIRSTQGWLLVSARAEGFAYSEGYMVPPASEGQLEMRIVLGAKGGRIQGQVIDSEGDPVVDALVRIGLDDPGGAVIMLPGGVQGLARRPTEVRSNAEGRFAVYGMPLGVNEVRVRATGLAPWQGEVRVEAYRAAEILAELKRGVEIHGKVSSAYGEPLAGVSIDVGNAMSINYHQTRTAANGSYRLTGLPSGEISIRARERDGGIVNGILQAVTGEVLVWDVAMSRGLELKGKVLDLAGGPMERVSLSAYTSGGPSTQDKWVGSAYTDSKGEFSLPNCPEGESLRVFARISGKLVAERAPIDPREGELVIRLDLDTTPSVRVRGIVVGPDGRPLGNVQVGVTGGAFSTDSKTGAFDVGPFIPGEFIVRINPNGLPPYRSAVRELFANETWDLGIVEILAGGTMHARLDFSGDGPRPRPMLQVRPMDGDQFYSGYTVTENHTQVLIPGSYRLTVTRSDVADQSIPFEIRVGETTNLVIDIELGVRRDIEFTFPSEVEKDHQVDVTILGERGVVLMRSAYLDSSERIQIYCSFMPGTYTLESNTASGLKGSLQFTVEAGQETVPNLLVSLR